MHDLVLTPHSVVARWANDTLVVHASGHEGGVTEVGIARRPGDGVAPEFEVTARMAPFAGLFPYGVTCVFDLAERPEEIVIVTSGGSERVPVT
ncbi:MAG TPA: hypothetical protein VHJ76_08170 [Actinomycetota bacterium]|nr:hypothetical protein [Actinomycetota bacterium]